MSHKYLIIAGLALAFAVPAAAQQPTQSHSSSGSASSGQQSGMDGQNSATIRQQVKHDLEQSGFTNVQVMPESFLVRAQDKQGRPVMMVINPDSVTAVTKMGGSGQSSAGGSPGSGSGGGGSTNSK